jgi:cation transport regulator ChaC
LICVNPRDDGQTSGERTAWVTAETDEGPIRALGMMVNRESHHYSGTLLSEEAADILASAAGHWGSCAEYLRETVYRLEELGITTNRFGNSRR